MNQIISAKKIQRWWKKHTCILRLRGVMTYLKNSLSHDDLQELSDCCNSITVKCKGDGSGLLGGCLTDMLLCEMFKSKLALFEEFHEGENDMKIGGLPLSQKKITGKSIIALDWSKNKLQTKRAHFTSDILLINLKTERWWKKNLLRNKEVVAGIYLIDKQYCKKYVVLSSNNKTNTLINSEYLYKMLNRSVQQHLFIEIPPHKNIRPFKILNAFS